MNFKEWLYGIGKYDILCIIGGMLMGGWLWGYDGAIIGTLLGALVGLIAVMIGTYGEMDEIKKGGKK